MKPRLLNPYLKWASARNRYEELIALEAERDHLRAFTEWVAAHQCVPGFYADDDHSYDEWITPDGDEMSFDDVVNRAKEVLGCSFE